MKLTRIFFALAIVLGVAGDLCATLTRQLPLDDNAASNTVVADTGANATLVSTASTAVNTSVVADTGPNGTFAGSFRFDDVTGHNVDIGSGDNITAGATASVEISVLVLENATTSPTASTVVPLISRAGSSNTEYIWITNDTTLHISTADGTLNFTFPSIGTSRWRTFLITHSAANNWRVFMDGVESSSGPQALTNQLRLRRIGRETGGAVTAYARAKFGPYRFWDSDESANAATLYADVAQAADPTDEPLTLAVVRFNRSTSLNATIDVTSTDLGTPRAIVVWGGNDISDATAADGSGWSIGMGVSAAIGVGANGVASQVGYGQFNGHNLTTATDAHRNSPSNVFQPLADGGGTMAKESILTIWDRIEDGFRLKQEDADSSAKYAHALLIGGTCNVAMRSLVLNTTEGMSVDSTIGFDTKVIIVLMQGDPVNDTGHPGFGALPLSFITFDAMDVASYGGYSMAFDKDDDVNSNALGVVSDEYVPLWDPNHSGTPWELTFSKPSAGVIRVTTQAYGEDDGWVTIICIGEHDTGPGFEAQAGIIDIGTGTGSQSPTLTPTPAFTPHSLVALPSHMTALNTTVQTSAAGTAGIIAATADAQFSWSFSHEDDVSPTNDQSLSDNQFANVPTHSGAAGVASTFTSFGAGGFTHDVTSAPGSTLTWPFLAFGPEASGGGTIPQIIILSKADRTKPLNSPYGIAP